MELACVDLDMPVCPVASCSLVDGLPATDADDDNDSFPLLLCGRKVKYERGRFGIS